jgi:toxin ParE1/3/4
MTGASQPVIWSPEAVSDLTEIWQRYTRLVGSPTADRMVLAIGDVCRALEQDPFCGRARSELRPGIRSLDAGPHVAFYGVTDEVTEIIRVVHSGQDLDAVFCSDPEEVRGGAT